MMLNNVKTTNMVRLSKENGFNPSIEVCSICGKDMGIVLFGSSYKDANGRHTKAPMTLTTSGSVCPECAALLGKGASAVIEVRDGEAAANPKEPFRTGRLIFVKKEPASEMGLPKVCFMEHTPFEQYFGEAIRDTEKEKQEQ